MCQCQGVKYNYVIQTCKYDTYNHIVNILYKVHCLKSNYMSIHVQLYPNPVVKHISGLNTSNPDLDYSVELCIDS